ncbi:MAG: hypothetical protein HUJ94_07365 [Bacteroidales bacterium]|nr:hypothetical protein [Bacteroidales bacterium]
MKTEQNFTVLFLILAAIQLVITNFLNFGPFVTLSLLPTMMLCLPMDRHCPRALLTAALLALTVDVLAEGTWGLNMAALLPVALIRRPLVARIFGSDYPERNEDFNFRKNGFASIAFAIFLCSALFMLIYIWADSAGTRSFFYNLVRFVVSTTLNTLLGLVAAHVLTPDGRR